MDKDKDKDKMQNYNASVVDSVYACLESRVYTFGKSRKLKEVKSQNVTH